MVYHQRKKKYFVQKRFFNKHEKKEGKNHGIKTKDSKRTHIKKKYCAKMRNATSNEKKPH